MATVKWQKCSVLGLQGHRQLLENGRDFLAISLYEALQSFKIELYSRLRASAACVVLAAQQFVCRLGSVCLYITDEAVVMKGYNCSSLNIRSGCDGLNDLAADMLPCEYQC